MVVLVTCQLAPESLILMGNVSISFDGQRVINNNACGDTSKVDGCGADYEQ